MITREITEEETSEIKVLNFLEGIKDYNEAHWKHKILPGMYAICLLNPYIEKPIQRISVNFKGYTLFPANLDLQIKNESDKFHFAFLENDEILYEGDVFYKEKSPINNESKLNSLYVIGGQLQRHFKERKLFPDDKTGLYSYQSMNFNVHNDLGELKIEDLEELNPKSYNIKTNYLSDNGNEANGHAIVTLANSRLIEMMAKRKLRKRANN